MGCCLSKIQEYPNSALNSHHIEVPEIDRKCVEVDRKSELGRGTFGTVYQGRLILGGGTTAVAIKIFRNGRLAKDQFDTELSAMKLLSDHDHVLKALGSVSKPPFSIVIELMNLGSLEYYLLLHQLDNQSKVAFSTQIADAMSYMFMRNCTHGDVATRNILLSELDHGPFRVIIAMVSDFGTARYNTEQSIANASRQKDIVDFGQVLRHVWGGLASGGNGQSAAPAIRVASIETIRVMAAECENGDMSKRPLFPDLYTGLKTIVTGGLCLITISPCLRLGSSASSPGRLDIPAAPISRQASRYNRFQGHGDICVS